MYNLNYNFSEKENAILNQIKKDNNIKVLDKFEDECYLFLYKKSNTDSSIDRYDNKKLYPFEKCFGNYSEHYNNKKYEYYHCVPKHIIKYYNFYAVETLDFPGEWYRADEKKNHNLMLTTWYDSLQDWMDRI